LCNYRRFCILPPYNLPHMKPLFFLVFITVCISASGQTVPATARPDSVPLPLRQLSLSRFDAPFRFESQAITSDSLYRVFQQAVPGLLPANPHFRDSLYYFMSYWGDCHAQFTCQAFWFPQTQKILIEENERYGGCRGMSKKYFLLVIPKVSEAYTIRFRLKYVDAIHGREEVQEGQ
jgi:hypothetical protein